MLPKQKFIVTTLAACVGAALVLSTRWSEADGKANKLEGAWVAKSTTSPVQGTYVYAPDSSGRRASLTGTLQITIPASGAPGSPVPHADVLSPTFAGEAAMTGADTASYSVVGYGVNKGIPFDHLAFIWVDAGEIKFLPSGQCQVTHHVSYYLPQMDADGDGLPDDGQTPVLCLSTTTLDTRIGVRAPCVP